MDYMTQISRVDVCPKETPTSSEYFFRTYSVENSTVQNSNLSYRVIDLFIYEILISAIYEKLSKLDAN
ncbi:unnamed protein product [Acanthoscelides obtectus]|uniref:Uncharacterized protein n=1 Tax=Acanthoscelides obtectus TaxID=200917 RepID=A0A9P0M1M9_ACAOB|nr:unnamed protein product [Acanthoscelides obtectus]CAK1659301.1 hypothetical protein AOBTE_LOCUS21397 [Acanthoscelides obtectus]